MNRSSRNLCLEKSRLPKSSCGSSSRINHYVTRSPARPTSRNAIVDRLKEVNLVSQYGGFVTEVLAPVEAGQPEKAGLPMLIVVGGILGCLAGPRSGHADRCERPLVPQS